MQVVKGTVVSGKVVLNRGSCPDRTEIGVFLAEQDNAVHFPPALQREHESALAEADQEPGISTKELFAELPCGRSV
jgi:hypothetical protein